MHDLIIVLISLLFSAFYSGMEIAFLSSNKLKFELDKKNPTFTDNIIDFFYKHSDQYISTILVGNNIALVIYGITMSGLLTPLLQVYIQNTFFVSLIQTILATIIILVTSEFLPKNIFRFNPNLWLRFFSPLLLLSYWILYPITIIATVTSNIILRTLGINTKQTGPTKLNRVDLNFFVNETTFRDDEETIETIENDVKIFRNALDFTSAKVRDCIVPRTEVKALNKETMTLEELKDAFVQTGFSKILIYKENIDNIVGYYHAADLFKTNSNWKKNLRTMPFVPETMAASKLMNIFTSEKKSLAVVVDEFGGTAGIVTLEDLMEEIFGEIEDEHDTNAYVSKKINDHEYIFSGRLEIDTVNANYQLDLPEDEAYQTIAGFILQNNQRFPKLNETIKIDKWTFKVLEAHNNRIDLIHLYL